MMKELTEKEVAISTLERYTGSDIKEFCSYLILTNFTQYLSCFAKKRDLKVYEGAQFLVAHSKEEDISLLVFRMGSPLASLTVDLCSAADFEAAVFLGMCGGLREDYEIGDYFVPVASIRDEGTSNFYLPQEVPAMANFLIQNAVLDVIQETKKEYHVGICHTTNIRFWEFNELFKEKLKMNRAQTIEMESATLFTAGYAKRLPIGSLMLISDLPLTPRGVKTKESSKQVFKKFSDEHVELGVEIIHELRRLKQAGFKGANRGDANEVS
jgi:AMP nucleosidase